MLTVTNSAISQDNTKAEVDIVCSSVSDYPFGYFGFVEACFVDSSISVERSNTQVGRVLDQNRRSLRTNFIKGIRFGDSPNLKFLPQGIKIKFPRLKFVAVYNCDLAHIDSEDMEQFGNDLQHIRFMKTKIAAIEADVFKFNPNLVYIDFGGSPLKYIDPQFFDNLKKMSKLREVDLTECGCVDKEYSKNQLRTLRWDKNSCSDESASMKNKTKNALYCVYN